MWRADLPMGNEAGKIKYEIVPYTMGRGLDLGSGPWKPYEHFTSLDNLSEWEEVQYRPDIIGDCEDLSLFADGGLDFVFSSHLLEHIEDYRAALKEWFRVIRPYGYLVLYLPHKDHYPNRGENGSNPDHKHDFLPEDIIGAMKQIGGWTLLVNETRSENDEYSFYQVYQRRPGKEWEIPEPDEEQPPRACVVRYGGFGDMMQTSSVLAALKRDGYRVTMMTNPKVHSLMCNDPNIDNWLFQEKDQVPNNELKAYWNVWEKKFDKFVNLSESVEGTWLALPGRTQHSWPQNVRAKYLDGNYQEFMHDLAGVDLAPVKFYPSKEDRAWAEKQKKKIGSPIVLMALAGSSVHKAWPHMDAYIAEVLVTTKAKIVLVGDDFCKILEQGWEDEERVFCRSGEWGIGRTLAFAQLVDVVIGPETGVLNAVSYENNTKIVLLSHSSKNNLTKHWQNTFSITPKDCPCYPCHRLHYSWEFCHAVVDGEGKPYASLCSYNIEPGPLAELTRESLNGNV